MQKDFEAKMSKKLGTLGALLIIVFRNDNIVIEGLRLNNLVK